jgi:proline dehydrogenase
MRLGAGRFVAGETLDEAVPVLRRLNEQGLEANTTILGEAVHDEAATRAVVDAYHGLIERLQAEALRCNVALKLTHLGVDVDEELALANVRELVEHAASVGSFVRIDMEDSSVTDPTLRIYRRLREAGLDAVGTVLQSYLFRTEDDLRSLLPLEPNLRIVKGAYLEPPEIAFAAKSDVDHMYARLVELSLDGGGYTAVATHDERLLEHAIAYAERQGVGRDRFELQMLYGIRPQLQRDYARRGFKVRVAAPFGREWYPFFMRRLAERPANLLFLARNVVRS